MTTWTVLRTRGSRCFEDALPFLMVKRQTARVVDPAEWRPLAEPGEMLLGAAAAAMHCPQFAARLADSSTLIYETENLLARESPWRPIRERLNAANPNRLWSNYSEVNAAVFRDDFWPLELKRQHVERPGPFRWDVLHVGARHPRREAVIDDCRRRGLRVYTIGHEFPVFGAELRAYYAASRLLLNVHFYTPGVFEAFRCVPAWHAGIPILSELSLGAGGGEGREICADMVPYEQLAATAERLCSR